MKLWTVFLVAGLAAFNAHCDELTPAKRDDIRLMMQETGSANLGAQMMNAMVPMITQNLSATHPEIPKKTLDKIGARIESLMGKKITAPGGMVDLIIPIYANHFTHEEIKQMLAFYRTDAGKKLISKMPVVMSESMAVGQNWGRSMGPEITSLIDQALAEDKVVLKKK